MSELTATQLLALAKSRLDEAPANYAAAYRHLQTAAELGDAEATYAIGTWHLFGTYLERDVTKAFMLIKAAADSDYPPALFDLATMFEKGEGTAKSEGAAFECYMRAALLGDKQAPAEVSRCWYYGIGIKKNERLAEVWSEHSEEMNSSPS